MTIVHKTRNGHDRTELACACSVNLFVSGTVCPSVGVVGRSMISCVCVCVCVCFQLSVEHPIKYVSKRSCRRFACVGVDSLKHESLRIPTHLHMYNTRLQVNACASLRRSTLRGRASARRCCCPPSSCRVSSSSSSST